MFLCLFWPTLSTFILWIDLSKLLAALQVFHCQRGSNDGEEDFKFLNEVLTSKELQALLRVHDKVTTIVGKSPLSHGGSDGDVNGSYETELLIPTVSNAYNISCEVIDTLQSYIQRSGSRDARDLVLLLQRSAVQVSSQFFYLLHGQLLNYSKIS